MKRFLDEVLDALADSHDSFEDLVFILPNKRSGTFLIAALAKRATKTAFAPRIISIEELLEELSGLRYASGTLQLFELYRAYDEITEQPDPFHEFLNWAGPVLQDFNEIDRYLIDPKKLFAYLSDIHEIKQWGIAADSTQMVERYLVFWKELYPLYSSFVSRLKSLGLCHPGGIYKQAALAVKDYIADHKNLTYIFVGFNALTKAESHVIQSFLNVPQNKIFWDMDAVLLQDQDHDASFFLRQYQAKWDSLKKDGLLGISSHYSEPKNITAVGVPKRVSQAQYVGHLLHELVAVESKPATEIAVVLGDESLLNPLLHAVPESIHKMNITMGYPLEKIPMAVFFKQLLIVYSTWEPNGISLRSILDLLDQPYLLRLFEEPLTTSIMTLRDKLRATAENYISPQGLRTYSEHQEVIELLLPDKPFSSIQAIERINRVIGRFKERFDSSQKKIELEYLHGFYRVFNQIAVHIQDYPFLDDIQGLLPLYDSLLQLERIDLRGEPLQGLQIMGMLESRVLDYETIILTSVNEGILPAGKSDNSLIPFDVKREFDLPTYKEKDAIYTYHFYRLLQRAKHIYLVYNTEPDVLLGGEKSRLILQLQSDSIQKNNFEDLLAISKDEVVSAQPAIVPKTEGLSRVLIEKLNAGVSPTLLAAYIRNPLEFYKKAILDIQDSFPNSRNIDAMTLGTLTHKAAESLYHPLKQQELSPKVLQQQKERIPQIVERLFKEEFPNLSFTTGRNYLAYHVVLQYLDRLLAFDIENARQHQITILELEWKLELELSIPGLPVPVRLSGVADRIDRYDEEIRVIDYKTGGLEPNELRISAWNDLIMNDKRQKAFQVLCYAIMVAEHFPEAKLAAGIISLKQMKQGFVPFELKSEKTVSTAITTSELDRFKEQLTLLLQEICDISKPFEERLKP